MKYLLDTNVLCEPTKRRPDPTVMNWLAVHGAACGISILSLGEIERGLLKMTASKRKTTLARWLAVLADDMEQENRVLPVSREVVSAWARLSVAEEKAAKRKPDAIDTLLAATAEAHGLIMVTRNRKDFPKAVSIINPWE